jgi:hypothetical protein
MSAQIHDKLAQHLSAWCGRDLVNDPWLVHFTPQHLTVWRWVTRSDRIIGYRQNKIAEVAFQPSVSA